MSHKITFAHYRTTISIRRQANSRIGERAETIRPYSTGTVREAPPFSWLASLTPTTDPAAPSRAALFSASACALPDRDHRRKCDHEREPVRAAFGGHQRRGDGRARV